MGSEISFLCAKLISPFSAVNVFSLIILRYSPMANPFKRKHANILLYGLALAAMFLLLRWLEWRYILVSRSFEMYIGLIAGIFMLLGIWLATRLIKPKTKLQTLIVEKEVLREMNGELNEEERIKLGISSREMEVLQLMADGLSNQEIASQLFVSLNTIKTHCSRLFEKMDVKRRTQAIEKAKRLQLIR
jgi:NarL family two-component system response regulator LiaR